MSKLTQKVEPSTREELQTFVERTRNSAPGPDGIPYAAWKFLGSYGMETLYRVTQELIKSECQAQFVNESLTIFLPKGIRLKTQ